MFMMKEVCKKVNMEFQDLIAEQEKITESIKRIQALLKTTDMDGNLLETYKSFNEMTHALYGTMGAIMDLDDDTEVVDVVCQTSNLDHFGKLTGNRDVTNEDVKRLMNSMSKVGQIVPAVVNENMEVIDGQHRIEACRRMNADARYKKQPVKFVISYGLKLDHVIGVNTIVRRWRQVDFIASHAQTNETCAKLKEVIDNCTCASSTSLIAIGSGSYSGSGNTTVRKVIENDLLRNSDVKRLAQIVPIIEYIFDDSDARAFIKKMQHSDKIINAMAYMISHENFNPSRFRKALAKASHGDRSHYSTSSFGNCLDTLQTVYNATQGKKKLGDLKANYRKYQAELRKDIDRRYKEKLDQ